MKIIKGNLTNNLKEAILHGLKDHDIAKYGTSGILDPISFYIKNQEKEIISAIVCQPFWGALHIKYVWTHYKNRKEGYSSRLMEEVFRYAKKYKFSFIYVETLNFQAPDFYKKFGFEIEFIRKGFSKDVAFFYMRKNL